MKQKLLLLLLFLFATFITNGQEINLKSSVTASAGGIQETKDINISKWKLGEEHILILQHNKTDEPKSTDRKFKTYPNPFTDKLNIQFQTDKIETFTILVSDISGKKLHYNKNQTILPNQLIQLNLAFLSSGFYLVKILHEDDTIQNVFKVQKL